jgi:hypothetical protein
MRRWQLWGTLTFVTALVAGNTKAMTLANTNLVDLIRDADSIVVGSVSTVTDGVDTNGFPYTEVTVSVQEAIRGTQSDTYTFRQIGLQKPRLTADGTKMMLPAPEGIPRYAVGEHVLLFMGTPASMTGLQSTIGLGFGKFYLNAGSAVDDVGNEGVFQNVELRAGLATANDTRILTTSMGAVNPDDLLSLVHRAVAGNWAGTCQMWKTGETPICTPLSRRPAKAPSTTLPKSGTPTAIGPTADQKLR